MNKLSSCQSFKLIANGMRNLMGYVNPVKLDSFVIPFSYYEDKLKALSTKKYPLVKPTLKAAKEGRIKLFNCADPLAGNKDAFIFPDYFTAFGFLSAGNKKNVAYVNAAKKTGYMRNNDGEPIALRTNETALYAYLQTGYVAELLLEKDAEITNNYKLQQNLAEHYAMIFGNIIDRIYPISGDTDGLSRLYFLLGLFYLQFQAGYDMEKALNMAIKMRCVDPVVIGSSSKVFATGELEMANFEVLVSKIEQEFPFIRKGTVALRPIIALIVKNFGSAALFAIEHSQSFLNMLQSVGLNANFYKDDSIKRLIKTNQIEEINKILLLISGE